MVKDKKPLKIRVVLYVEVDREAYEREYHEEESAANIREHVRGVVISAAQSAFQNIRAIEVK